APVLVGARLGGREAEGGALVKNAGVPGPDWILARGGVIGGADLAPLHRLANLYGEARGLEGEVDDVNPRHLPSRRVRAAHGSRRSGARRRDAGRRCRGGSLGCGWGSGARRASGWGRSDLVARTRGRGGRRNCWRGGRGGRGRRG